MAGVPGPRVVSGGGVAKPPLDEEPGGLGVRGPRVVSGAGGGDGGSGPRVVSGRSGSPAGPLSGPRVVAGAGLQRFEEADESDVGRAMAFAATLKDDPRVTVKSKKSSGDARKTNKGAAGDTAASRADGPKVASTAFEQLCTRVTSLSNLKEIYVLDLTSKGLETVGDMGSMCNLRMVNLGHNKLKESFGERMPAASVQELRLHNNRLTDCRGLGALGKRVLRVLCLSHNAISDFGEELKGLRSLEVLKADSNRLTVLDGAVLPPSLVQLDVGRNQISLVKGMDKLAGVEELNLSGNNLKSLPPGLERMAKLSDLHLNDNPLLDCKTGLAPLRLLRKTLGSLHLQRNPLVGPSLASLPKLSALVELTICECEVTSLFALASACPSLEYLDASRNRVPSAGQAARDLAGLKDVLEEIRLEGNPLCDEGGAYREILEISLGENLVSIDGVPTSSALAAAAAAKESGSPQASPRVNGRPGTPLMQQPRPGTASRSNRPGTASGLRPGTPSGQRDGEERLSGTSRAASSRRMIAEWDAVEEKVEGSRMDWRQKFGEMRSALNSNDPRNKPDNDLKVTKAGDPSAAAKVAALGNYAIEDRRPVEPLVTMSLVDITARPSRRRLTGAREFADRFATPSAAKESEGTPSTAEALNVEEEDGGIVFTDSGAGVGLTPRDNEGDGAFDVSLMQESKASYIRSAHQVSGPVRPGSARPLSARPPSSAGGARAPLVATWGSGRDPNVSAGARGDGTPATRGGGVVKPPPEAKKKGGFRGFKTSTGKQVRLHNAA